MSESDARSHASGSVQEIISDSTVRPLLPAEAPACRTDGIRLARMARGRASSRTVLARHGLMMVPVARNVDATADPDVRPGENVIEEADEPGGAPGVADDPKVEASARD